MADATAVQLWEAVYRRTDKQIRDLLGDAFRDDRAAAAPEIDTINVIIGDGANPITAGIAAALRVDFRARITGYFLQEFDGITGSVAVTIERTPLGGSSPIWVRMSPVTPVGITTDRYYADVELIDWVSLAIERGDYLRFLVTSAATITRVHLALRIRRLEP